MKKSMSLIYGLNTNLKTNSIKSKGILNKINILTNIIKFHFLKKL